MKLKIGDERQIAVGPLVGLKVRVIGFNTIIKGDDESTAVRCVLCDGRFGWKAGDEIDVATHELGELHE